MLHLVHLRQTNFNGKLLNKFGLARGPGIKRRWSHEIFSVQRPGGPKLVRNVRIYGRAGGKFYEANPINSYFPQRTLLRAAHFHHFLRPHTYLNFKTLFNTTAFPRLWRDWFRSIDRSFDPTSESIAKKARSYYSMWVERFALGLVHSWFLILSILDIIGSKF